ncbi:MAG: hypothetical protein IJV83_00645 [Clostridia bacterium]|nr:hypothetical protein [Clostridia bacterium]
MKKLFTLALSLTLCCGALALTACKEDEPASSSSENVLSSESLSESNSVSSSESLSESSSNNADSSSNGADSSSSNA